MNAVCMVRWEIDMQKTEVVEELEDGGPYLKVEINIYAHHANPALPDPGVDLVS